MNDPVVQALLNRKITDWSLAEGIEIAVRIVRGEA